MREDLTLSTNTFKWFSADIMKDLSDELGEESSLKAPRGTFISGREAHLRYLARVLIRDVSIHSK